MTAFVADIVLAVLFGIAAVASVGQIVVVGVSAARTRKLPDLSEVIPWGAAGLGLLAGAVASLATRGLYAGTLGMPNDLAGYLAVLAISGWGFGVIHAKAASKWQLRAAWIIAPIAAATVLGAVVGLLNELW
ncbi:MAG: hypothetical protein LBH48_07340 [Bifidobacteriaceae bacterium]|nr:hypothetical protein [Bifidobacteriaceae bacterium]